MRMSAVSADAADSGSAANAGKPTHAAAAIRQPLTQAENELNAECVATVIHSSHVGATALMHERESKGVERSNGQISIKLTPDEAIVTVGGCVREGVVRRLRVGHPREEGVESD